MRIPISGLKDKFGTTCSIFALAVGVPIVVAGVVTSALSAPSPERAALRIAIAKQQLMQDSCTRIARRITRCYSGKSPADCAALSESNAWFVSEFGEYPEMACPRAYDSLAGGAKSPGSPRL
jgi:hypothetical protein